MQVGGGTEQVAEVINSGAAGPFLLVCEHASNHIPAALNGLGLDAAAKASHIAWDPGALEVASAMSERLNAPLVASRISRLVYDCNRPPDSPAAVPARSDIYDVPGNARLSEAQLGVRARDYYEPFRNLLAGMVRAAPPGATLVTVHSFTPVYFGRPRDVEIGILHDSDSRLADVMLASAGEHTDHVVRRNEPYSPEDGVTHTLKQHAIANGLANVMLEIRSNLVTNAESQRQMADMLSGWLTAAVAHLTSDSEVA